eukprot:1965505-Pyramimonas_sp.AAC.1
MGQDCGNPVGAQFLDLASANLASIRRRRAQQPWWDWSMLPERLEQRRQALWRWLEPGSRQPRGVRRPGEAWHRAH